MVCMVIKFNETKSEHFIFADDTEEAVANDKAIFYLFYYLKAMTQKI